MKANKKSMLLVAIVLSMILMSGCILAAVLTSMWTHTITWDGRVLGLEIYDNYGQLVPNGTITIDNDVGGGYQDIFILHNNGTTELNLYIVEDRTNLNGANPLFDMESSGPRAAPYTFPYPEVHWSPAINASDVYITLPVGWWFGMANLMWTTQGSFGSYTWMLVNSQ